MVFDMYKIMYAGFSRVIKLYFILSGSVILKTNETCLDRNKTRLERNKMCLTRNEMRCGNSHLSGTVLEKSVVTQ